MPYYIQSWTMVFSQNLKISIPTRKDIGQERDSQEEQNGTNVSFIAPSSEELWVRKEIWSKRLTIDHGFRPKTDGTDFDTIGKSTLKGAEWHNFSFIAPCSEGGVSGA